MIFILIVIILMILIYFPRSINMVLSEDYINKCDEVKVIVTFYNPLEYEEIIIKDKAKIREIYNYINSYRGRWSIGNRTFYSTDANAIGLDLNFKGENFYSRVHIIFNKYIEVYIDNYKKDGYSDIFFKIYGKGIDSEELLKLLNIELKK